MQNFGVGFGQDQKRLLKISNRGRHGQIVDHSRILAKKISFNEI